jgi:hypothetical protein
MLFSPLGFSLLLVLSLSGLSLFGFSFLSPFSSAFLGSIYRGQGRCFLQLTRGAAGCRPLGAAAEVRWVVRGGWSAIVFGRWAPGERVAGKKFKLKQPFFLLPRCMFGGKKKDEQCRSKRHRSALSLFFFF